MTIRLGLIVPSTNTTIERLVSSGLLNSLYGVEVVVTRLKVETIAPSASSTRQFHPRRLLAATGLLAAARPDSVTWTGTSGLWIGMDNEAELLTEMSEISGAPATSASASMFAALRECRPAQVAVLTPYETTIHAAVLAAYQEAGFTVAADEHFGITDNAEFAAIPGARLIETVKALAPSGLVSVVCTNILCCVEGVDVVDSTLAMFWHALTVADPDRALSYLSLYHETSKAILASRAG